MGCKTFLNIFCNEVTCNTLETKINSKDWIHSFFCIIDFLKFPAKTRVSLYLEKKRKFCEFSGITLFNKIIVKILSLLIHLLVFQ